MSATKPTISDVVVVEDGERIHEDSYTGSAGSEALLADLRGIVESSIAVQDRPEGWEALDLPGLTDLLQADADIDVYVSEREMPPLFAAITDYNDQDGFAVSVFTSREAMLADIRIRLDAVGIDHSTTPDEGLEALFGESGFLAPTRGRLLLQELEPRDDGSYVTEGM